jgi:Ornithine cyclodeaminase/mu-crystallin family
VLILDAREVEALLDVDALIDALGPALADLGAGRASLPGRIFAAVPERQALFGDMPAYVPSTRALVSKVVSVFPGNAGTEVPVRQAVILAFDPDTGTPGGAPGRHVRHGDPDRRLLGPGHAPAGPRGRLDAGHPGHRRPGAGARGGRDAGPAVPRGPNRQPRPGPGGRAGG